MILDSPLTTARLHAGGECLEGDLYHQFRRSPNINSPVISMLVMTSTPTSSRYWRTETTIEPWAEQCLDVFVTDERIRTSSGRGALFKFIPEEALVGHEEDGSASIYVFDFKTSLPEVRLDYVSVAV